MATLDETYQHFLDPMRARWDAPYESMQRQEDRLSYYASFLTDYPLQALMAGFKDLQQKHAARPKWPTLNQIELVMQAAKPEVRASAADWNPDDPPWLRHDREARDYALGLMDTSVQAQVAEAEGWGRYWLEVMTSRAREALRAGLPVERAGDTISEQAAAYGRAHRRERLCKRAKEPVDGFDYTHTEAAE